MNGKQVMEWIKSHVGILLCMVVILASLIAIPLVARSMNESLREDMRSRAAKFNDLGQLERTQIRIPSRDGESEMRSVLVNQRLLEQYRRFIEHEREDAEQVYHIAVERNRNNHDLLMPELFPAPPAERRDLLPPRFHTRLMEAYDELLRLVNAGIPPTSESMMDELRRREFQIRTQVLQRGPDDQLDEDERRELRQQLMTTRLIRYKEAAESMTFYGSKDMFALPVFDISRMPYPMEELFDWQWNYWLHRDLLAALYRANNGQSLLLGPVKRVIRVTHVDRPEVQRDDGTPGDVPGGAPGGRGGGGGGGLVGGQLRGGSGFGETPDEASDAPPARPIDPTAESPRDFAHSLSGRKTNPLYDVRYVRLELIVDGARLPELMNALAAENFMTVLDVSFSAVDPYEHARSGYFYGDAAIVRAAVLVETIWFRDWTAPFMPESTRRKLGVATDQPG